MIETNRESNTVRTWNQWATLAGIAIVSLIYFADVCIRASDKFFWADELFTVYLCELPRFSQTWAAVVHAVDFNPPLFYLLTRGANYLFGEGMVATRLPAIVGFWIFGLCLFVFVSKRAGAVAGFIASVFPFFTLAQYYAYEARPHGITLGWCGLATVCWQRAGSGRWRYLWLGGFAASLICALLTHVYAVYLVVPFALVVLYDLVRNRRIDWGTCLAIALSLALVLPLYISLRRNYRSMSSYGGLRAGPQDVLQHFFVTVVAPSIVIFLFATAVLAFGWNRKRSSGEFFSAIPERELVLAAGLSLIPVVGIAGIIVTNGPFFDRYFLAGITGYAMFLGFLSGSRGPRSKTAGIIAGFLFLLFLGNFALAVRHWKNGWFGLQEPISGYTFSPIAQGPLARNATIEQTRNEDVLIVEELDYIYLYRYAPPDIAKHLFFAAESPYDVYIRAYDRLSEWAKLDLKTTTFEPFFKSHDHFAAYATQPYTSPCGHCVETFLKAGYTLKSATTDLNGTLYEYERRP